MPLRPPIRARTHPFAIVALCVLGLIGAQRVSHHGPASGELYLRSDAQGVRAVIELAIEPGWKLYHSEIGGDADAKGERYPGKPLVVTPSGGGLVWAPARVPEPLRYHDPLLDNWAWVHRDRIRIYLAAAPAHGELPDAAGVRVRISGATCSDDGVCMRYDETLEPQGRGPDAAFAGFPPDLLAAARP